MTNGAKQTNAFKERLSLWFGHAEDAVYGYPNLSFAPAGFVFQNIAPRKPTGVDRSAEQRFGIRMFVGARDRFEHQWRSPQQHAKRQSVQK